MNTALLYGNSPFYLDHIAPLALLLKMKLFVTEKSLIKKADQYYPEINMQHSSYHNIAKEILKEERTFLFSQLPSPLVKPIFLTEEALSKNRVIPFFVHHGQSDKDSLFGLKEEKLITIYGDKMKDDLKRLEIYDKFSHIVTTGNYRYNFYLAHHKFYKKLINSLYPKPENKITILYAPSWSEPSIKEIAPSLIKNLPSNCHLYLKFHPNTEEEFPGFIEHLQSLCTKEKSITFVSQLCPIYPLLDQMEIYLGDTSSIGYDFLTFNRPLYFIRSKNPQQKTTLLRCGQVVEHIEHFYKNLSPQEELSQIRSTYYNYVFDTYITLDNLKEKIINTCKEVSEDPLFLL